MAVTFDDALVTLQSMFTEMDKEVLTTILEANNGHMENTVICLLKMSGDNSVTQENSVNPAQLQQEQHDELFARNLQNQIIQQQREEALRAHYQYYGRSSSNDKDEYWPQHSEPDPLITWISSVGEAAKK